jgi:hypothetical protein
LAQLVEVLEVQVVEWVEVSLLAELVLVPLVEELVLVELVLVSRVFFHQ